MKLPIDIVPGTNPPKFRWSQWVEDLTGGRHKIEHASAMPASAEKPIAELIAMTKNLARENAELREQLESERAKTSQIRKGKG